MINGRDVFGRREVDLQKVNVLRGGKDDDDVQMRCPDSRSNRGRHVGRRLGIP
jgi:hypothetical protein